MSEPLPPVTPVPETVAPGVDAPGVVAPAPMSAGRLLAGQREQAGLHLAALAATLKVPLHKLQALEEDRLDALGDIVFVRALASGVCRVLKIDAAPVLALLPRSTPVALKDQQGLNTHFKEAGERSEGHGPLGLPISRVTALIVIGLLVAALVVAFVPHREEVASAPQEPVADASVPKDAQAPEPGAAPVQKARAPVAPEALAQAAVPVFPSTSATPVAPASGVPATGGTAADSIAPAPSALPAAPVSATAVDPLVIQARQPTWIQVRDSQGAILTERTLQPGDRYVATGNGPWAVVIGRADGVDVSVRGQAMDLSAVARSNVARFEVK